MTRDWRLEQLETQPFLREVDFVRKPYRRYRPDWDHDQCAACGTKLAEPGFEDGDVVHEGYATTDAFVSGADYEWVCVPCFQLFQREMCWSDMTDRSP